MSTPVPAEPTTDPADEDILDPAETDAEPAVDETDADPEGSDSLGDPGKKALATMKDRLKAEREKRRTLEAQLAERDKPAEGTVPGQEALIRQAETTALARVNERLVKAEVKAAAAGKLADPADAHRFLDLSQFEVDDDGNVDAEELTEAIDELLQSKPYLAAQGGSTKPRFQGTADSGARKGTRPTQLTEADVKRLSAAGNHAEIVKAQNEGRLNDYLGLTR
ncbi:phage scaffolding protein [[Kitasatospora] papulosa]